MSDLMISIEKSIKFFARRYPNGHPILSCLEAQLADLTIRKEQKIANAISNWRPSDQPCCDKLSDCAFFYKVSHFEEVSEELRNYVTDYCCGPEQDKCFRLQHIMRHGEPAHDSISPVGKEI